MTPLIDDRNIVRSTRNEGRSIQLNRFKHKMAILAALAVAGCHPPESAPTKPPAEADHFSQYLMLGVQHSSSGALTLSPKGSALSVIYPDATLQWLADEKIVNGKSTKQSSRRVVVAANRAPLNAAIFLRGQTSASAKAGARIELTVEGRPIQVSQPKPTEDFSICVETRFSSREPEVVWKASLTNVPGEEASMVVDTMDILVAPDDAPADRRVSCTEASAKGQ